jgi:hypothetical protein
MRTPDSSLARTRQQYHRSGKAWSPWPYRHNPVVKATYQRLVQRGRPKKAAIVGCLRQLPYNPQRNGPNKTSVENRLTKKTVAHSAS